MPLSYPVPTFGVPITMSLVPQGSPLFSHISLYASVQVAVTTAALYDHVLSLGREIELIWMKPLSLVTLLYAIERYLGDIVLIAGLCLCFPVSTTREVGIRLFEFRAWGALAYSWATQGTMQLRLYAMYRQSRRILVLLLTFFFCEIAAIAFIIWRAIGPSSDLKATSTYIPGEHFCAFSGINGNFVYIFIPFLCFEAFLFFLAARVFVENVRHSKPKDDPEAGLRLNPFMSILARDSLCYFFVNLVASAVVTGLWQGVTEPYANICIPLVMFLEVLIGTRLILDFRERYHTARPDGDPVVSGRYSSLHFREEDGPMDSTRMSIRCQIETIVVTDET